jgi:alcohol dehydrogenase YqhD (iron-dependent ADH family)
MQELSGMEVREFFGVEPNPRIETLRKGIEIAREFQPDLILAVGGGSVLDGSKLIAAATYYDGDAWEILEQQPALSWKIVPLATVLTISATGSEMNGNAVITNWEKHLKPYFSGDEVKPVFSIVDPTVQFTLPKEQVAYGIVDAYSHVLEQYINTTLDAPVQDRFAEGILLTLIEYGRKAIDESANYDARSQVVFAATMALNNLIGVGVTQDWATHQIEHVISAHYDIAHGAGLAIITPRLMKVMSLTHRFAKMVQYGKRVWNLSGSDSKIANAAITKTHEFFASLGINMTLTALGINKEESYEKLVDACIAYDDTLVKSEVAEILANCY